MCVHLCKIIIDGSDKLDQNVKTSSENANERRIYMTQKMLMR